MTTPLPTWIERRLHQLFELSLLAKALFALAELLSGLGVALINGSWLLRTAQMLTAEELGSDPNDRLTLWALGLAQHFSVQGQHFWAMYLIVHGVVKLVVVGGLVARIEWAYPASIVVLVGFIAYQLERFYYTHSLFLIALTLFDMVVIWLIWHEYQGMKAKDAARAVR